MLLSGNCGCEIPTPPRTGLAGHYYNPPFRISGAYGYAPAHSLSGPSTATIDTTAPYPISPGDTRDIVWIREVKLRSKPAYKKDLIIGKVEVNKPYKVIAATRSISANFETQPVGKMERVFLLIAEVDAPDTPIGWAIPAEHYRESETQYIDLYWAYFSDSALASSDMDAYNKKLKDAEALVDKLEKAKGGGGGDGSGSGSGSSSNTPPPPPPKKKMSNTTVIMLGLGAAAAIYYFISKVQKE